MKIMLSENLRKMRRDRNLTQEDVASYLGISFQAVSKWERDEGYPDISMLPVIANFFGVSVDTLIGNDVITKEERIQAYCEEYERLNRTGNMDEAVSLAEKAYRDYPYDWQVIDVYIRSLTKGYSEYSQEKLPELRSLCHMVKDKCSDATIRMHAVYSMLFAEIDDMVEEWFSEVPGTYDYCEWEQREARYLQRNQMDQYRHQKQNNMMQLCLYLYEKIGANPSTPQEKIVACQTRASLLNAFFGGENAICVKYRYAWNQLDLASAFFECGRKDEGYATLEEAIQSFAEWFSIPENTELQFVGLFDTLTVKRVGNKESVLRFLIGENQSHGLQCIACEEKFLALSEKLMKAI